MVKTSELCRAIGGGKIFLFWWESLVFLGVVMVTGYGQSSSDEDLAAPAGIPTILEVEREGEDSDDPVEAYFLAAKPGESIEWVGDVSLESRIYWLQNALQSPFLLQNRPAQKILFSTFSHYHFPWLDEASLTILSDASYLYLLDGEDWRDEFLVFVLVKWDQPLCPDWQWNTQSTITTLQQPFDITDLREDRAQTAVVRGSSLLTKVGLDWQSAGSWRGQLLWQGDRNWYQDARENYGTIGSRLEVGCNLSKNCQLTAWSFLSERMYDDRKIRFANGERGTSSLRYKILQSQVHWKQVWRKQTRGWHLSTTAALDFLRQDDNGGGYYNYDRWGGGFSMNVSHSSWRLHLDARNRYYDYAVRKANDQRFNYRWEYEISADMEYQVNERYSLTAGGTWFKSQGNDQYDVYEYFQYYFGLKITFDLHPVDWPELSP